MVKQFAVMVSFVRSIVEKFVLLNGTCKPKVTFGLFLISN